MKIYNGLITKKSFLTNITIFRQFLTFQNTGETFENVFTQLIFNFRFLSNILDFVKFYCVQKFQLAPFNDKIHAYTCLFSNCDFF